MRKKKIGPFYCYLVTNLITNRVYVGKTDNIPNRWEEHKRVAKNPQKYPENFSYIHKSIIKHGIQNFIIEQLEVYNIEQESLLGEKFWIKKYNCKAPNGYNLTDGGDGLSGYVYSEEQLKEKSKRMMGKFLGEKNPFYGKTHTEETRKKISEARKNASKENYLGSKCSQAKLNEEQVIEIKTKYLTKQYTTQMLCKEYNVTDGCLESILSNKNWSHVAPIINLTEDEKRQIYWDLKLGLVINTIYRCDVCQSDFTVSKREKAKSQTSHRYCSNLCKYQRFTKKRLNK